MPSTIAKGSQAAGSGGQRSSATPMTREVSRTIPVPRRTCSSASTPHGSTSRCPQGLPAHQAMPDRPGQQAPPVPRDRRDRRDHRETRAPQDRRDRPARQGRKEKQGRPALRGRRVRLARRDPKEKRDRKVLPDRKASRDPPDRKVHRARQVRRFKSPRSHRARTAPRAANGSTWAPRSTVVSRFRKRRTSATGRTRAPMRVPMDRRSHALWVALSAAGNSRSYARRMRVG